MTSISPLVAIKCLDRVNSEEYRTSKLPSPVDNEILNICESYVKLEPTARQQVTAQLSDRARDTLTIFADRMTMFSVRQNQPSALMLGLVALEVGSFPGDWKEILMMLSLFYNSATRLGLDADDVFQNASQFCQDSYVAQLVIGFPKRLSADRSIEAMGFTQIDGPSGIIYRLGEEPIPDGFL